MNSQSRGVDNSHIEAFGNEASSLVAQWNKQNFNCLTPKIEINFGDHRNPKKKVRLLIAREITLLLIEFDSITRKFMGYNPALTSFEKQEFTLERLGFLLSEVSRNLSFS